MNRQKRTYLFRWIYTLLTIGTVVFIFTNSLQTGEASSLRSIVITEWLNRLLENIGIGYRFTEYAVRKWAHWSEFLLLGFFLTLMLRVYTRRIISFLSWPLFVGLLTAVIDETIQLFGNHRGPSLRDVWIDFAGFVAGLCIAFLLMRLIHSSTKRNKSRRK